MTNTSNNNGLKAGLAIAIILLLGTAFYTYTLYNDSVKTEKELIRQKEEVISNLNEMSVQYDAAIGENEVANKKLVEARDRINNLMDSLKVSENNARSLRGYYKKYHALQEEMDILLEENDKLKQQNTLLTSTLDSTKTQLEERVVFNDSLLAQNTELAEIVENAAVLTTAGLEGYAVIERSSGKLIPTERAKRADKLRICYTVVRNQLVDLGNKSFFVQVIDPKNNVLGLNKKQQFDNKALNYSLISKFNYENENLDICEFIAPRSKDKFESGNYKINIFDEDKLVSTSEFALK